MCFRPAESGDVPVCPNCGKKVPVMGGVKLKKCPHCKADMDAMYADCPACGERIQIKEGMTACPACNHEFTEAEIAQAASSMTTPVAPKAAPGAPKAPGTPKAPGAPKAPSAIR